MDAKDNNKWQVDATKHNWEMNQWRSIHQPWLSHELSQAIGSQATYYWLGSAIEPMSGGATGSRAGAEPSRTVATLVQARVSTFPSVTESEYVIDRQVIGKRRFVIIEL